MRILNKFSATLKKYKQKKIFNKYISNIDESHPFFDFKKINHSDCSADPKEFFSHYDSFSFWLFSKLDILGHNQKVLDLGGLKNTNGILSIYNDVNSIVLIDCEDEITKVKYFKHDVSDPLPFKSNSFDVFSSVVSLNLIGLGRYGDKINHNAIIDFVQEIERVMKKKSHLIFSISCGSKNYLKFNEGYKFEFETIKKIFINWDMKDYLIDNNSYGTTTNFIFPRFTKDLSYLSSLEEGEHKVVFFHFSRKN